MGAQRLRLRECCLAPCWTELQRWRERTLSFAIFKDRALRQLVRDLAKSDKLVALVGAGASVESQLPSWQGLVRAALRRAAIDARLSLSEDELEVWAADTIKRDSLLGAMAIAEALIRDPVEKWLPDILYGEPGPAAYQPGPISRQVANLKVAFGDRLDIVTTNYDDLLEVALEEHEDIHIPIVPFTGPKTTSLPNGPHIKVAHPHGFYGRDQQQGDTVLTLRQYHELQRGSSWQETHIGSKIMGATCLFVGMSMTDSNILRYLDFYSETKDKRHAALIVRQGERSHNENVQRANEAATNARWNDRGIRTIFLDHFADVAYLIHEISYCCQLGVNNYRSLDVRSAAWIRAVERKVLAPNNPGRFREGQNAIGEVLRDTLDEALQAVAEGGVDIEGEKLAMSLWLLSPDGKQLTCWCSTDRLQYDPETVVPVRLDAGSKWIAVRALCEGKQVVGTPTVSTSRWGYIVGLPLHVTPEGDGTLPVGCLTITSMKSGTDTVLTKMPADVQSKFNGTVRKAIARFLMEGSK